jgi:hypothetical protein
MGVFALGMGRRGVMSAVVIGLLACVGATPAGAAKVYVGDGEEPSYSIALKTEAGAAYVLGLSARGGCEPGQGESNAQMYLSVFAAPKEMRLTKRGFASGETIWRSPGITEAHLLANFAGDASSGSYVLGYREESISCEEPATTAKAFEAHRYLPIGEKRAAAPAPGEARVYYDVGGPTQFFARSTPGFLTGIRGAFVTGCPVGSRRPSDASRPLNPSPGRVKLDGGRFHRRTRLSGLARSGAPYAETIAISGRETEGAVIGTYLRVRTTRPWDGRPRRCVTGPLPIDARRYLPARR